MEHNFWFWILESAARSVLGWVTRFPNHEYMGLAYYISTTAVEMLSILWQYVGLFIGFKQIALFIGAIIFWELALATKRLFTGNLATILKIFV